jgi:hypothetical protein
MRSTLINADNKLAIAVASNPEYHACIKHINIQYHYVREKTQDDTVVFSYVLITQMAANDLTKALERVKFERWVRLLSLHANG